MFIFLMFEGNGRLGLDIERGFAGFEINILSHN